MFSFLYFSADLPPGYILCAWCQKPGVKLFTLKNSNGMKAFCSELCFTQCRRASFKKNKVCDWCKHVRHTVNYVDFQDGEQQLQFCSDKCLGQYKMHIFCKETQEHLQQVQSAMDSPGGATRSQTPGGSTQPILITPDLWLQKSGSPNGQESPLNLNSKERGESSKSRSHHEHSRSWSPHSNTSGEDEGLEKLEVKVEVDRDEEREKMSPVEKRMRDRERIRRMRARDSISSPMSAISSPTSSQLSSTPQSTTLTPPVVNGPGHGPAGQPPIGPPIMYHNFMGGGGPPMIGGREQSPMHRAPVICLNPGPDNNNSAHRSSKNLPPNHNQMMGQPPPRPGQDPRMAHPMPPLLPPPPPLMLPPHLHPAMQNLIAGHPMSGLLPPNTMLAPYPVFLPFPIPVPIPIPVSAEKLEAMLRRPSSSSDSRSEDNRSRSEEGAQTAHDATAAATSTANSAHTATTTDIPTDREPPRVESCRKDKEEKKDAENVTRDCITCACCQSAKGTEARIPLLPLRLAGMDGGGGEAVERCLANRRPPTADSECSIITSSSDIEGVAIDLTKDKHKSNDDAIITREKNSSPHNTGCTKNGVLVLNGSSPQNSSSSALHTSPSYPAPLVKMGADHAYSSRRTLILDAPSVPRDKDSSLHEKRFLLRNYPSDMPAKKRCLRTRIKSK